MNMQDDNDQDRDNGPEKINFNPDDNVQKDARPVGATGALKVWLWLVMIVNLVSAFISFSHGAILPGALGLVNVFAAYKMLGGYKYGFYIFLASSAAGFTVNLAWGANIFNAMTAFVGALIIWLLAMKQWKYFR